MSHYHHERVWHHSYLANQRFLTVTGPSGGGKTTLVNALTDCLPYVQLVIKYTDRAPRKDLSAQFAMGDWTSMTHSIGVTRATDHIQFQMAYRRSCLPKVPMGSFLVLKCVN